MSAPSIWVDVTGWFTPTVLFVALNIVIGTIAVTSMAAAPHKDDDDDGGRHYPRLSRTSSVLERVRSFNLSFYRHSNDHQYYHHEVPDTSSGHVEHLQQERQQPVLSRRPSLLERIKSIKINPYSYTSEQIPLEVSDSPVKRTEAEKGSESVDEVHQSAAPAAEHIRRRRSEADSMLASGAEVERMDTKLKKFASDNLGKDQFDEEEVDARADDFISKFRQQLKFQRLESIRRYTEVLKRGATCQHEY